MYSWHQRSHSDSLHHRIFITRASRAICRSCRNTGCTTELALPLDPKFHRVVAATAGVLTVAWLSTVSPLASQAHNFSPSSLPASPTTNTVSVFLSSTSTYHNPYQVPSYWEDLSHHLHRFLVFWHLLLPLDLLPFAWLSVSSREKITSLPFSTTTQHTTDFRSQ